MGYPRIKPEHAGAKNGGGAWMTRAEAKQAAKRGRRQVDKWTAQEGLGADPIPDDKVRLGSACL